MAVLVVNPNTCLYASWYMVHGTENGFTSGNEKADVLKSGQLVEGHPTVTFLLCLLGLKKTVVSAVTGLLWEWVQPCYFIAT